MTWFKIKPKKTGKITYLNLSSKNTDKVLYDLNRAVKWQKKFHPQS